MDLSDELSPLETSLASELAGLVEDPDEATRRSIMRAVMQAPLPVHAARPRVHRATRFALALVAAVLLLVMGATAALAGSSHAVPTSPAYGLRLAGEDIRLTFAQPKQREELRIGFARDRFQQARDIARSDHHNARLLVAGGHEYLAQVRSSLGSLSADEQGEVENELDQASQDENDTQNQVGQQGSNDR
jgi:hypothetical protein